MNLDKKPKGYWTKEKCQEVALKFSSKSDFSKQESSAYQSSIKHGWLEEICSHMKKANHKAIFDRILPHKIGNVPKNYWFGEMRTLKILLEERPFDFWMSIIPPGDKINSLNWFRTDFGRRYLEKEEARLRTVENQKKLSKMISERKQTESPKEIPVEDFGIVDKPKTPLDFLTYG